MIQSYPLLSEKISGYQLAEHLLCEGGVEALIRYAGVVSADSDADTYEDDLGS